MYLLRDVLSPALRREVLARLDDDLFVDGGRTASGMAKTVKANEQVELARIPDVVERIVEVLKQHREFQYLAIPRLLSTLLISRYREGMAYGTHTDNAVMPGGGRSDLSFTLMLSETDAYDGGNLCMETAFGEKALRIPAGAMVLYPTGGLHRVAEVTRGERIAIVGWVQSRVRDPEKRLILHDLDTVLRAYLDRAGHDRNADLLLKSIANLRRMWDE